MAAARELITLQFGPYANHVGAHFWNAQDELLSPAYATAGGAAELDAGALYCVTEGGGRVGAAPRYTPRVLVFDARNSAGLAQAAAAWLPDAGAGADAGGQPPAARRPPPRQHAFQRYLRELESGAVVAAAGCDPGGLLEHGVSSWGDFTKALLHPRSLVGLGSRSATGEQLGGEAAASLTTDSAFDAFTMGHGLANEALLDCFRHALEGCDRPQGVQAVVDVCAGWGGLAEEVLGAVREELPRGSILVLGAAPPARAAAPEGAVDGSFDYAGRSRGSVRGVNLGLAFAAFGAPGNELGAHFIPLCLQPYADACAAAAASAAAAAAAGSAHQRHSDADAWFPGLPGRPDPASDYHTSALLAAGWEAFTSPLRRSTAAGFHDGDGDVLVGLAESAAGDAAARGRGGDAASGGGRGGGGEGLDARSKHGAAPAAGGGGGGAASRRSDLFDPELELAARQPAVGLPRGGDGGRGGAHVTLGDLLATLTPSPAHMVHTLSLALPFPHPRATATQLHRVLLAPGGGGAPPHGACPPPPLPPIHMAGLDLLAPLSWMTSALPSRYYHHHHHRWPGGGAASSGAPPPDARAQQRLQPLAHALLLRGVGSHATVVAGPGGAGACRYVSSVDAYGRVLDDVMARSGCRQACHGAFRTPLPMPLSFPCALFRRRRQGGGGGGGESSGADAEEGGGAAYDDAGGLLDCDAGGGEAASGWGDSSHGAGASGMSSVLPLSVPAMLYACTGPTYAPALRAVQHGFGARDGSVLHRFAGVDWAEAESELADLADAYAAGQGGT